MWKYNFMYEAFAMCKTKEEKYKAIPVIAYLIGWKSIRVKKYLSIVLYKNNFKKFTTN